MISTVEAIQQVPVPGSEEERRASLTPSLRWPGFFRRLCEVQIRPDGIDIADLELREGVTDADVDKRWEEFKAGNSPHKTVEELANELVVFPERKPAVPRERSKLRLADYSKEIMKASAHYADLTIGTQIGVPKKVLAPGGRFDVRKPGRGRLFYWDMLWTLYGAVAALGDWGRGAVQDTLTNFEVLANKFGGNIPNVNTTWAETRSQPPILGRLVRFRAKAEKNDEVIDEHLELMERHYLWRREGADDPAKLGEQAGSDYRRVVRMPNGKIMYRFYDNGPDLMREFRDEMGYVDMQIERELEEYLGRPLTDKEKKRLHTNIGAGAEDGEDFTGENCKDKKNLFTICTTEIVSVKLNALMYDSAIMLAFGYAKRAEKESDPVRRQEYHDKAKKYEQEALDLAECINTYCIADNGFPANYNFVEGKTSTGEALSGVFALSSGIIPQRQGEQMLEKMEELFLKEGGFINTLHDTDMQWDRNVWPLMQMEAVLAAITYGRFDLALKWCLLTLENNELMYEKYGCLFEKSHPYKPGEPGGRGEYACVKDLLMSHGVDMALRKLLRMLIKKASAMESQKAPRSLKDTAEELGKVLLRAMTFVKGMNNDGVTETTAQTVSP